MSQQSPPPGWYATDVPGQQRWWDGAQWTDQFAPPVAAQQVDAHAGSPWGKGSPGLALGLGVAFSVLGIVALIIAIIGSFLASGASFRTVAVLGFLGLAFVGVGVVSFIDARAGYKVRKLRQQGHPRAELDPD